MLNHYSPEEKLTAVALTKLNIQKHIRTIKNSTRI